MVRIKENNYDLSWKEHDVKMRVDGEMGTYPSYAKRVGNLVVNIDPEIFSNGEFGYTVYYTPHIGQAGFKKAESGFMYSQEAIDYADTHIFGDPDFAESLTKRSRSVSKRLSESVYEILYDYDDESGETYRNNSETFEGTWSELQDYIKQMRRNGCYNIDANEIYEECTELKEADYSETDEFTLIKEMNHWIKDLKSFFVDDSKAQKAIADYFYYDDGVHQEDFKELQAAVKTLHKLWLKLDAITEVAEEKEYKRDSKKESLESGKSYKDYWAYKQVSKNWESDVNVSNNGNNVTVTIWFDKKAKDVYAKFRATTDNDSEDGKFWLVYDITDGNHQLINDFIEIDEENDNVDDIIKHCFYYFNTRY